MNPSYLPEALEIARLRLEQQEVDPFLQAYENVRRFQPTSLPQSIIHGDVVPPNCLFIGAQLAALIDWEEVTLGASILDIAMSILLFCQKALSTELICPSARWIHDNSSSGKG